MARSQRFMMEIVRAHPISNRQEAKTVVKFHPNSTNWSWISTKNLTIQLSPRNQSVTPLKIARTSTTVHQDTINPSTIMRHQTINITKTKHSK